jgi:5'-3' exonuclease
MGIPSYFSYIVKNHPEIIKQFQKGKTKVDNLYLDCNSIIYDVFYTIDFKNITESISLSIIKSVCSKIEMYIHLIRPSNNIIIAFDGVAPVAKLEQQRQRRYKSVYQNNMLRSIYKKIENNPWNTATITPGTKFMKDLSNYIISHFNNPGLYNSTNIITSTSEICGEGEHKIFEFIRQNKEEHLKQTTVIYGLDADLIMLSINHLPCCKNIFLFRETPHFIQTISSELEPNENYLLDIPQLTNTIITNMNNGDTKSTTTSKVYDYIFLSFFLGNDFLPHFPAINIRTGGMDKMINAYKETIGKTNEVLTDGIKIYWKNVRILIQYLAVQEETYLKQEYKIRDKKSKFFYPTDTPEQIFNKFEAVPTYERNTEKYINPFQPYWESRYYRTLFNIKSDSNNERKKQICINYLEGLEWTLKYYTSGCPDWRWKYHYNYPPLLSDLLQYIPVFDNTFIVDKEPNPVSSLVQLCYVLPKDSLSLLPKQLENELIDKHVDWYNTNCDFTWAFCKFFWESHVNFEEIDLSELENIVENYLSLDRVIIP